MNANRRPIPSLMTLSLGLIACDSDVPFLFSGLGAGGLDGGSGDTANDDVTSRSDAGGDAARWDGGPSDGGDDRASDARDDQASDARDDRASDARDDQASDARDDRASDTTGDIRRDTAADVWDESYGDSGAGTLVGRACATRTSCSGYYDSYCYDNVAEVLAGRREIGAACADAYVDYLACVAYADCYDGWIAGCEDAADEADARCAREVTLSPRTRALVESQCALWATCYTDVALEECHEDLGEEFAAFDESLSDDLCYAAARALFSCLSAESECLTDEYGDPYLDAGDACDDAYAEMYSVCFAV